MKSFSRNSRRQAIWSFTWTGGSLIKDMACNRYKQERNEREELLLDPKELELVYRLRRVLSDLNPVEAVELLKNRLRKPSLMPSS